MVATASSSSTAAHAPSRAAPAKNRLGTAAISRLRTAIDFPRSLSFSPSLSLSKTLIPHFLCSRRLLRRFAAINRGGKPAAAVARSARGPRESCGLLVRYRPVGKPGAQSRARSWRIRRASAAIEEPPPPPPPPPQLSWIRILRLSLEEWKIARIKVC